MDRNALLFRLRRGWPAGEQAMHPQIVAFGALRAAQKCHQHLRPAHLHTVHHVNDFHEWDVLSTFEKLRHSLVCSTAQNEPEPIHTPIVTAATRSPKMSTIG